MALQKSLRRDEIPEGAEVLGEKDALNYQMEVITKWSKSSEVFALKYAPHMLSVGSFISGAMINNYFRKVFLLGNYGHVASYLPICVIPGVFAGFIHIHFVMKPLLLMKHESCPVCLETRAASLQGLFGGIYPLIIGPVGCASIAYKYATYHVPSLINEPKEAAKMFWKLYGKGQTKLTYIVLAQFFFGALITHWEIKNLITMMKKSHVSYN